MHYNKIKYIIIQYIAMHAKPFNKMHDNELHYNALTTRHNTVEIHSQYNQCYVMQCHQIACQLQ